MQLDWTTAQKEIRDRFHGVGVDLASRKQHPERSNCDGSDWLRLCEEGLWRLIIAEEFGGEGQDWWGFAAALEGLSTAIRSPGLMLSTANQASMIRALALYGTPAQQKSFYEPILQGKRTAMAIAESTSGTDVKSMRTQITKQNGTWVLDGEKYNIGNAPAADIILVIARRSDQVGDFALVVLDGERPGIERSVAADKLGNADLLTGELTFTNVQVDDIQILGRPSEGARILAVTGAMMRSLFALTAANIVAPFLNGALRYATDRQSDGMSIDRHQYVQGRLVDIKIGAERTRWLALAALGQLLTGHDEAIMTSSIAKLVAADDLMRSAMHLLKLYGSDGYRSGKIATFVCDALGFASVGGTEEMHRRIIFDQLRKHNAQQVE
jgi:alkylation response protein AidB-like acyl-CoA dehydrogenase